MADNPQQTIRELKELVIAYAKQETVDPIVGLWRYVAFGIGGAFLIGTGILFLAMSALRALQGTAADPHFTGNWSWAPYAIVVVASGLLAALFWWIGTKKKKAA